MASFPKKSMWDVLTIRIQIINDNIRIAFMTSSKHNNLEILTQLSQALHGIWSHIDASFDFSIIRECNFKGHIMWFI